MDRLKDLRRFYVILNQLERKLGGKRKLANCNGYMDWPQRGVYFFFEPGEIRTHSGQGPRVVRVGTHALISNSQTTLWKRLSQHQGTLKSGGGNHRGSIFRLHVGTALINRDHWPPRIASSWGKGNNAPADVRQAELPLEQAVSQHIRQMPFLWLAVEDEPGPASLRGVIERNAIALLSDYNSQSDSQDSPQDDPLDPPSPSWLGLQADRESIRHSGLWNVNNVTETYDPAFLVLLEGQVNQVR
ncbi:MAG: hypothetical protein JW862_07185 [Anaerolineales bacterium]|nr:hypothetical protein [Anaerolineales bacterium]